MISIKTKTKQQKKEQNNMHKCQYKYKITPSNLPDVGCQLNRKQIFFIELLIKILFQL
jgi:hypothetical protein